MKLYDIVEVVIHHLMRDVIGPKSVHDSRENSGLTTGIFNRVTAY